MRERKDRVGYDREKNREIGSKGRGEGLVGEVHALLADFNSHCDL